MRRQSSNQAVAEFAEEISPKTVATEAASTPRNQALENGVRF